MQQGDQSLSQWVPWIPALAIIVSLMIAGINAWSARRIDTMRAFREHMLTQARPGFVELDQWFGEFLGLLREDSKTRMLEFLKNTADSATERRSWLALEVAAGSPWPLKKRYDRFIEARTQYTALLEHELRQPQSAIVDPRLAYLQVQVDYIAGVTRGQINVFRTFQDLRRALIKTLFRKLV